MMWMGVWLGILLGSNVYGVDPGAGRTQPPSAALPNPLNTVILQPAHDVTLTAGETLHGLAGATGDGAQQATFTWMLVNLGTGSTESFSGQSVDIPFPQPGAFRLFCTARVGAIHVDLTPASRNITVVAANHAPETEIIEPVGTVAVVVGTTVHFVASGSDPDGDTIGFVWRKVSPQGVAESTLTGISVDLHFTDAGVWTVTCTAVDQHGEPDASPATMDIEVFEANGPPDTVILSPADDVEIDVGDRVVFEGTAVGGMAQGISINWQVTGGLVPRYFRGERVTIPFQRAGRFDVSCTAKNALGESDQSPDQRTVTVRPISTAVETEIVTPDRDLMVAVGTSVAFRAEGQPADATFAWEISRSGAGSGSRTERGQNIQIDFFDPGIFDIACTAVTPTGETDPTPAHRHVQVVPVGVSIFEPEERWCSVLPGTEILFEGSVVSPPSEPLTPYWYLKNDPGARIDGTSARFTFAETGTFTVVFEVVDGQGRTARDYRVVRVQQAGELGVSILEPQNGARYSLGQILQFRGQITGDLEANPRVSWIFAGQAYSELEVPDVVAETVGRFNVTLVAALPDRQVYARDQVVIEIFDPERASRAEISHPMTDLTILPGDTVFFDGQMRRQLVDLDVGPVWRIVDAETQSLLVEARRQTLGRVAFPSEEGEFIVSFALEGPGLEGAPDLRRIRVRETRPEIFADNDAPERAVTIEPGRYRNLRLVRPNYFRLKLERPSSTLKIKVDVDGSAQFCVYRQAESGEWIAVRQGTLPGSGAFQVNDIPAGDYLFRLAAAEQGKRDLEFGIDVSVLLPALYFPDIREDDAFSSWIGLVNPHEEPAEIDLTAFDADGSILEKVSADLVPHGRLHAPLNALLDSGAGQVAWVRLDSNLQINGYCLSTSHDDQQVYAMTGATKLSSELFVPHIAQETQQWYSRASVVNGSPEAAQSRLITRNEDRELDVGQGYAQDAFDFLEKFGGILPSGTEWGICSEETSGLLLAGSEVFGKIDGNQQVAGLILDDVAQSNPNFLYISRNIYFTHIARDVAQFWTGLALVNVSDQAQSVRMSAYGAGGALVGQSDMQLAPGEKRVGLADTFLIDGGSLSDVDWVAMEADREIVGYELFGSQDNRRLAGLEAKPALSTVLSFPLIDASGATWHGVAMVNVHETPCTATCTLLDDVGTVLATQNVVLQAHEKLAVTLTDLFGTLPATAGWVLCIADQPLCGFELVGDHRNDTLAALLAL